MPMRAINLRNFRGRRMYRPWALATMATSAALLLPIIVIAASVFLRPGDGVWQHLRDTLMAAYIGNSLALVLGVGSLVLPLGVIPAWLVTWYRFPLSRQLEWALLLPLAMPAYIIAYTYTGLLDVAGPLQSCLREVFSWEFGDYWFPEVRSLPGAVIMLSLVLYPYVYLLARTAFTQQSVCVVEAARTLGVTPARAFFRVVLPLARPALCVGLALVLMETLADYGTVQYFGVTTFTTGIFKAWFGMGSSIAAAQLSAALMLFMLLLILLERYSRRQARYHHSGSRSARLTPRRLRGSRQLLALVTCMLPLLCGFLIPAVQLSFWAVQSWDNAVAGGFLALAGHSIQLATLTAVLATLLALALCYARRLQPGLLIRSITRLLSLGYAIPGTVIAVGVLVSFTWLDQRLGNWLALLYGADPGLLLSGTIIILIFAYLTRFLTLSLSAVEAGLTRIRPAMDEAGRCAGLSETGLLRRVHAPMLRGSLLTAALLVFVDVLKELPATLILRPFNFNTLAVRAYELANEERLAAAALPALTIVLMGIIPVILLSRGISHAAWPGGRAPDTGDYK